MERVKAEGKPAEIAKKIVEGQVKNILLKKSCFWNRSTLKTKSKPLLILSKKTSQKPVKT
jgi:translation elongation factor EF-Ts